MSIMSRVTSVVKRYERTFSSVMFVGGFLIDNLTLGRIDVFFSHITVIVYLALSSLSILFLTLHEKSWAQSFVNDRTKPYYRFLMEFSFGGLFSAFFVFYSHSATLISSWPFLILLGFLLIGNELFKSVYSNLVFQLSIWYFTLLSYLIFLLPILTGSISTITFVQSTVVSLIVMGLYIICLALFSPVRIKKIRNFIAISVASVFTVMHLLYFTNILPPLPLAIKEIGIYHKVTKVTNGYELQQEISPWYKRMFDNAYHVSLFEPVYVWSSVFAPTKISTVIYHEWQYYDEQKNEWITSNRIMYPITGGRDGGYRGYTFKQNALPGLWRVNVRTQNGRIIGRIKFAIEQVGSSVPLQTITK